MIDYNEKINYIDSLIKRKFSNFYKYHKIPGISIGILKDDKLIYSSYIGYANMERKIPIKPDTVFRVANLTAMFTTMGILQLWEKGKFKLDDPVNDYLPKGKIIPKKKKWPAVTFRHLLTQTSGIGELPGFSYFFRKNQGLMINKGEEIPRLSALHTKTLKTSCPAGEKYAYSNVGISLLGYLTEILTGERWEDYIRKNILVPLGMFDSDLLPNSKIAEKEAVGYKCKRKKLKIAKYRLNINAPAANLYSNINDMMKFASMLLNDGRINDGGINDGGINDGGINDGKINNNTRIQSIIGPETLKLMSTPQYYTNDIYKDTSSSGFCFLIGNFHRKKIVEKRGIHDGFSNIFTLVPEEKIAVCVLSNVNETYKNQQAVYFKNLILHDLLMEERHTEPKVFINISSKQNSPSNPKNFTEFKGYYAPIPGLLTNLYFYKIGGSIKISSKKDYIEISHATGPGKLHPTPFYPTDDPLIFKQKIQRKYFPLQIAFEKNKKGKIAYLDMRLFKLRKISYFRTDRFRGFYIPLIIILLWCIIINLIAVA